MELWKYKGRVVDALVENDLGHMARNVVAWVGIVVEVGGERELEEAACGNIRMMWEGNVSGRHIA
jgi:hypothetical protein